MPFRVHSVRLTPTGAAGSAAASGQISVPPCRLVAVQLDYTSQPATTDVTLTNMGRAVFTRSNSGTDGHFPVREATVDVAGTAVAAGDGERFTEPALNGSVTIAVAQGDPVADGVIVILHVRE